jgi:hypothetical protein
MRDRGKEVKGDNLYQREGVSRRRGGKGRLMNKDGSFGRGFRKGKRKIRL